ncbi:MAG: hypothetical protein WC116_09025 [Thermovirgaceae bacterium]
MTTNIPKKACAILDVLKALPDNGRNAKTVEELAAEGNWYEDAVAETIETIHHKIREGTITNIRIRVRGRNNRYWAEEVDDNEPVPPLNLVPDESEPEPSSTPVPDSETPVPDSETLGTSDLVDWTPEPKKVVRIQDFIRDLPRSRDKAVTITDLKDRYRGITESTIHNKLSNIRKGLKRGEYYGVSGKLHSDKVTTSSANPNVLSGRTTITVAHYWIEEDHAKCGESVDSSECLPKPHEIDKGDTPSNDTESSVISPNIVPFIAPVDELDDNPHIVHITRPEDDEYDPPFDDIGLPGPEAVTVLTFTDLEKDVLVDIISEAIEHHPEYMAWQRIADKVRRMAP